MSSPSLPQQPSSFIREQVAHLSDGELRSWSALYARNINLLQEWMNAVLLEQENRAKTSTTGQDHTDH